MLAQQALYGLKQVPRIWFFTLASFLKDIGFLPLSADLAVFCHKNTYIAVYVDDMLIVDPSLAEIQDIKGKLHRQFQMSDLGPCHYYLGMSVRRDCQQRILSLSQHGYIEKVLRDFGMDNAKPAVTPIETSKMEALPDGYECSLEDRNWYARVIGSLMYAMLGTRVDIAYFVSFLGRFLGNPGPQHIRDTKRIMRYLRGTTKLELTFCGNLKPLVGYTDSD